MVQGPGRGRRRGEAGEGCEGGRRVHEKAPAGAGPSRPHPCPRPRTWTRARRCGPWGPESRPPRWPACQRPPAVMGQGRARQGRSAGVSAGSALPGKPPTCGRASGVCVDAAAGVGIAPQRSHAAAPARLHALQRLAIGVEVQLLGGVGAHGAGAAAHAAAAGLAGQGETCRGGEPGQRGVKACGPLAHTGGGREPAAVAVSGTVAAGRRRRRGGQPLPPQPRAPRPECM